MSASTIYVNCATAPVGTEAWVGPVPGAAGGEAVYNTLTTQQDSDRQIESQPEFDIGLWVPEILDVLDGELEGPEGPGCPEVLGCSEGLRVLKVFKKI